MAKRPAGKPPVPPRPGAPVAPVTVPPVTNLPVTVPAPAVAAPPGPGAQPQSITQSPEPSAQPASAGQGGGEAPGPTVEGGAGPSGILLEFAWEVCNQVGGIYQVVRSKAPTMVERWGERYCMVGPYEPHT
ncbi:MAG: hypothetical protein JNJ48_02110, partial [Phycisphaerae bacterium]|nr:hypothetical protein [Phycisphaerae bacterium]